MTTPVKIESVLGMLTIRLNDSNYCKWSFQFKYVLRGYKLFDHFDGTLVCPPKFNLNTKTGVTKEITFASQEWETVDLALLSLLIATLSDDAIEHVLGCKTANEAWSTLEDRFAIVSKSIINMLKTEFQTLQKGANNIDKFLSRLKSIRDQLIAAVECVSDNDMILAALVGLPREYAIIRTVILARKTTISLKEFRAQLLNTERDIEGMENALSYSMAAMFVQGTNSHSHNSPGSSSNSSSHDGVSSATVGHITLVPYYSTPICLLNLYNCLCHLIFFLMVMVMGLLVNLSLAIILVHLLRATCILHFLKAICNLHFLIDPTMATLREESVYPPSSSQYQGSASTSFPPSTSMNVMFAQNIAHYQTGEAWILDTGASHHMTSDVHNLNQVVPFEGSDKIKIGNGQGQGNKRDTLQRKE